MGVIEAGGGTLRLRAVGDVEEAVQVLETDLGALVREVQGGIVKYVSSLIHHIPKYNEDLFGTSIAVYTRYVLVLVLSHITCSADLVYS